MNDYDYFSTVNFLKIATQWRQAYFFWVLLYHRNIKIATSLLACLSCDRLIEAEKEKERALASLLSKIFLLA
jgi:hypothetical protein